MFKACVGLLMWILISSCPVALAQSTRSEYIDFTANSVRAYGQLIVPVRPNVAERIPLVHVFVNAGGFDGTGPQYIKALNEKGIATFEVDNQNEWDFAKNVRMAMMATRIAVEKHNIDPKRVGMMGFSHGGFVSVIGATEQWMLRFTRGNPFRFKAFAALYPVCSIVNELNSAANMNWKTMTSDPSGEINPYRGMLRPLTGKLLLLVGENDDYEDVPTECPKLLETITAENGKDAAEMIIYPGAGHGWDVPLDKNRKYPDKISRRNSYIRHYRDEKIFQLSLKKVVDFFVIELGAKSQ